MSVYAFTSSSEARGKEVRFGIWLHASEVLCPQLRESFFPICKALKRQKASETD